MRANHSPLQFFGLMATASVLASGVCANAALAGTMASTTAPNEASASPMLVGSSSASETGTRGPVDGTRTAVDSNRTSRSLRSVTTFATSGGLLSPTSVAPASSATPGQRLVQVTSPAAPAPASRPAATQPVAAAPPTSVPTATHPVATSPSVTRPTATHPVATSPSVTRPTVTHPVATSPSVAGLTVTQPVAAPPTATSRVATGLVATKRVATPSLRARSASLSPGRRTGRLHYLQTFVTQWLRAEKDQASRVVTPPDLPLSPAPGHPSWGVATGPLGPAIGSPRLAGDTELETGLASVAAAPRRPERAQKPPSVAPPRAATPPPIPQALSPAPPVHTRLPVGGAAASTGGGVGSVAPSVVAELQAIALALATILLVRFSLDRAMWRSTLLASRLEHPG